MDKQALLLLLERIEHSQVMAGLIVLQGGGKLFTLKEEI